MLAIDAAHGFGDRIPDIEDLTPNGLLDFLLGTNETEGEPRLQKDERKFAPNDYIIEIDYNDKAYHLRIDSTGHIIDSISIDPITRKQDTTKYQ